MTQEIESRLNDAGREFQHALPETEDVHPPRTTPVYWNIQRKMTVLNNEMSVFQYYG